MFIGRGRKRELLRNKNQLLQQRHWKYDHNEVLALIKKINAFSTWLKKS